MRTFKWILLTTTSVAALCLFAGFLFVVTSGGMTARTQPSEAETWAARTARAFAMPASARQRKNPIPNTSESIAEGLAHWADHCAVCHGNNGDGQTAMGKGLYPPAPDMRQAATQQLTDGELFFVIENGVRFTGMPGWGGGAHGLDRDSEAASWKLVGFIRHLPALTFEEKRLMEHLNPKSPDEFEEEKLNEEFLRGDDSHDNSKQHR